jgi:hypothetical protein
MEAGCIAYVPKPVQAEAVFAALVAHLGVEFVEGPEPVQPGDVRLSDPVRSATLAARLREAIAIGAVSDLEAMAEELARGGDSDRRLGHRLAQLAASFDFDGVRTLAASLTVDRGKGDAG